MSPQQHNYKYEGKPNATHTKIVNMVGANKRVLELGPGPGMITRLLKENSCRIVALELDESAIELVTPYCESVHSCNLNNPYWPETVKGSDRFDVIVAGDVLEHLYDPWQTMSKLGSMLVDDGYVVLSFPNAGHNAVVACLLGNDFDYRPWGLLDKTHIRFFCIKNIQQFLSAIGLKITEVNYVIKTPTQTELAQHWRKLSLITKLVLGSNKFGNIYQVVVKAVPHAAPGIGLQLTEQPVPLPTASPLSVRASNSRILVYLTSFLSVRTRRWIARFLTNLGVRL